MVLVLAVEYWTSSKPSAGCSRIHGNWHNTCFVDLDKALNHVPRGALWGILQEYEVRGPLLEAIWSLYNQKFSSHCQHVRAVPVACWTPAGLPFLTSPVHNFHG
ncbi:hypothetical protein ILYODFUR_019326 [Ilyodon furcidens]|uniref:Uncharacterized protein n=1 Tax=Ilyodon furcidens TaxID=33524 RepID=A0ABV0UHC0_9TELE